jgi:hypothetical protein
MHMILALRSGDSLMNRGLRAGQRGSPVVGNAGWFDRRIVRTCARDDAVPVISPVDKFAMSREAKDISSLFFQE